MANPCLFWNTIRVNMDSAYLSFNLRRTMMTAMGSQLYRAPQNDGAIQDLVSVTGWEKATRKSLMRRKSIRLQSKILKAKQAFCCFFTKSDQNSPICGRAEVGIAVG